MKITIQYKKLAAEVYCEETCKKCSNGNTALVMKYTKKLSQNRKDQLENICMNKTNFKNMTTINTIIESIRKQLEYLYNKFSNIEHPFSDFPIENYDKHSIERFIKKLYIININSDNNRNLLYNISKRDLYLDLNFIYDISEKIVIDPLIEKLLSHPPVSSEDKQIYEPIKANIKTALSELFKLEKNSHEALIKNKNILNQNKDKKKIGKLYRNQYINHYGYRDFYELLINSLWFINHELYNYNLDLVSTYNILLLNKIIFINRPVVFTDYGVRFAAESIFRTSPDEDRTISQKDKFEVIKKNYIKILNFISNINTEIKDNIILYKNTNDIEYIYYGYLTDYLFLTVHSFIEFCRARILVDEKNKEYPIISKEKRKEILNNLLQRIKDLANPLFLFEYSKPLNKDDIFEAFNIFITYLKAYNVHRTDNQINSDLLKNATEKSPKVERMEKAYNIRKEKIYNLQLEYSELSHEEQEAMVKKNKKLFDSWENGEIDFERFITERDTKKGTMEDFYQKIEEAEKFIDSINEITQMNFNPGSDYDLKLVFREIFINYNHDKTINLLKKYYNNKKITAEEFLYLKEKFLIGYYRQYDFMKEYRIIKEIESYLIESLFKTFFSFNYDTILNDLHKAAENLTGLLESEFSKL
ncbi:MAG: hypothetical protein FWF92_05890 [Oscillospiraceae bacterium]|nr:hypothetical protein [Oscillospiraceae bacterium]